jgi:hypothetical protein
MHYEFKSITQFKPDEVSFHIIIRIGNIASTFFFVQI